MSTIEHELAAIGVPVKEPWISTMVAYADEFEGLTDRHGDPVERNLDFKAVEPCSIMEWVAYFPLIVKGYNAFDAECAEAVGKLFPDAKQVICAREGSVCVYVVLPKPLPIAGDASEYPSMVAASEISRIRAAAKCDEVHQTGSVLRLWWD